MRRPEHWSVAAVRISAGAFGALAFAIAASICVGRAAPLRADVRFALAHYLLLPVWVIAACFGFAAESGARAWTFYLASAAVFAAIAWCAG